MDKRVSKIYLHYVYRPKNRLPLLDQNIRDFLKMVSEQKAMDDRSPIIAFGGIEDHIHMLLKSNPNIAPAKLIANLKGSSSYYLNKSKRLDELIFRWQRGYYVESVSPRNVNQVIQYIDNQELRHKDDWLLIIV